MEAFSVLAVVCDAMKRGWRHQQNDGKACTAERRDMNDARGKREFAKRVREHHGQLKSKQSLCARKQHTRFGEHVLNPHVDRGVALFMPWPVMFWPLQQPL